MTKLLDTILVCPECHGPLTDELYSKKCSLCELTFPSYAGILDFRGVNPNFQPSSREIKLRNALLSAYDTSSFENLIEIRFATSTYRKDLIEQQKAFELNYEEKGNNRSFQIHKLVKDYKRTFWGKDLFLEIGCGSGTAIPWCMKGFERGIGVDYSLIDLIVGNKFFEEYGIANIKLVCGDARQLPLPDGIFDFANAIDVIEHILPGQEEFMTEVKRVLKKGGGFYFNSPNRYNIFTPEPHVKARFVGFMPRKWMNRYVKMMKGVSYTTIRLLSLNDLNSLLYRTFYHDFMLTGPFMDLNATTTDFKKKVIKQFPFLLKFINKFFRFFTSNYQVVAFKTLD